MVERVRELSHMETLGVSMFDEMLDDGWSCEAAAAAVSDYYPALSAEFIEWLRNG